MADKGPNAFRTISEASAEVGAPAHVLRFWETQFSFIQPMRRTGGRRFYRPRDVGVLAAVRRLLHEEGLSIRDLRGMTARAVLERAASFVGEPAAIAPTASRPERLSDLRSSLERAIAAKQRLDSLLSQSAD